MKVLITGAGGFIGKNLRIRLGEREGIETKTIAHGASRTELGEAATWAEFVFHLAGVNRPTDVAEFETGNAGFTQALCDALKATKRPIPVLYTSSTQAQLENPYGISKRRSEQALDEYHRATNAAVFLYRLPNVFGKWCRPSYNSAVATFCHNIARGLPIQITDPQREVTLVYIDDVVNAFMAALDGKVSANEPCTVTPTYTIRVGDLAAQIQAFKESRLTLITERVGVGLTRALYSTFVSYLPTEQFVYEIPRHSDPRGSFVEMLKTPDSGQFSFFTAHPGITRGGHYHHTKVEKFLVLKGQARFGFRHILTDERYEVRTSAELPQIVETIPGWSHDVTNVGSDEMIVMLWANEVFDRARPDTRIHPV